MEKIIDLHIHTNYSDGNLSPKEVILEAKKNGVSVISIADHDTIDAYSEELFDFAKENGIELFTGVEISTKTLKCGIHVLGYNIDIKNVKFREELNKLKNARHIYLHEVSSKLNDLGYIVNYDELDKIESVTKAHIALDIINNTLNKDILIENFGHIPNKGEFIETIMNESCPAYVKKNTVSPKDAAKLIHSAGGIVVLAHPVAYSYEDSLDTDSIKNLLSDMNADGVECFYIYYDKDNVRHDDIDKWYNLAKDLKLGVTIGSDFHNDDSIHPLIGLINEKLKKVNYNEIYDFITKEPFGFYNK